jgi:2-phospho-L-lactate transferase/gluconeogenesis factor (CofD/UPF0052 family)
MPTIFDIFGIRAFIIPGDHEPIHIHIEADDGFAKIQVYPQIKIVSSSGIKPKRLKKILELTEERFDEIIDIWNEYNFYRK